MTGTDKQLFVKRFYQDANIAATGSKILPDTIIAAAALESNYGKSGLASKYNNFFGRKPEKTWKGKTIVLPTKEFVNGKWITINQGFKWYDSPADAFRDYVRLLTYSKRYAAVSTKTTAKEQFEEIQKAGYATDPGYSQKLQQVWEGLKPLLPIGAGFLFLILFFYMLFPPHRAI